MIIVRHYRSTVWSGRCEIKPIQVPEEYKLNMEIIENIGKMQNEKNINK